jgi:peptidyl-prolyl cis-trans isomerase B (cyclophilin B)
MIQGGCPNTRPGASGTPGTGGPGYHVDAEFNDTKHKRGILSMARSADPNSAGSQFFVMVADYPSLDGQYTAFGRVVAGLETADAIVAMPRDARDKPNDRVEMTVEVLE